MVEAIGARLLNHASNARAMSQKTCATRVFLTHQRGGDDPRVIVERAN